MQILSKNKELKNDVKAFWNEAPCGKVYARGSSQELEYEAHSIARYELEPYIKDFGEFSLGPGKDVLEIGVGLGCDHLEWAKSEPKSLIGIDFAPSAVNYTRNRLSFYGLDSRVDCADAENLPFDDNSFDIVYSWGVLHHSPDTPKAINEAHRVLRPGGVAKIMIYNKYSMTGYMLWFRYGLMRAKPFRNLDDIYACHLESPGTKAYTIEQARDLCRNFSNVQIRSQLSFGDLLLGESGQRHKGFLLSMAKTIYPRYLVKSLLKTHGIYLLITAMK